MFCNGNEIKSIMTETDNGKPNNEESKESDYEKKVQLQSLPRTSNTLTFFLNLAFY